MLFYICVPRIFYIGKYWMTVGFFPTRNSNIIQWCGLACCFNKPDGLSLQIFTSTGKCTQDSSVSPVALYYTLSSWAVSCNALLGWEQVEICPLCVGKQRLGRQAAILSSAPCKIVPIVHSSWAWHISVIFIRTLPGLLTGPFTPS